MSSWVITFFATDRSTKTRGLYNPHDPEDIERYFGEPFVAQPLREQGHLKRALGISTLKGIDPEHPLIVLRPGERVLGHTHEFLGILPPGMGNIQAVSTSGRNGLTIAQDATLLNPGWVNRLVLEIKNENEDEYLPLLVGTRIGQMTYHGTGPVEGTYGDSGSYQPASADDIEAIVGTWSPYDMRPKAKNPQMPPVIPGLAKGIK
jgi:dCTP deaminase